MGGEDTAIETFEKSKEVMQKASCQEHLLLNGVNSFRMAEKKLSSSGDLDVR
jgi:hypothetical protein